MLDWHEWLKKYLKVSPKSEPPEFKIEPYITIILDQYEITIFYKDNLCIYLSFDAYGIKTAIKNYLKNRNIDKFLDELNKIKQLWLK